MSGTSSVGNRGVYEAGDQRNSKESEQKTQERFEEGVPNSHLPNDPKDERSIANRLAREEKRTDEEPQSEQARQIQEDATLPARAHGNKPSRGAEIDQELREEEEEILKKKGSWGPKQ